MTQPITRKILNLGDRHVHTRFCGNGPPMLILHQSPRTSEEMEPLMQAWGEHFTCIAPDHPGYGLSDPLDIEKPNIDDFGRAVCEVLDHLNIDALPIYGHHTGANIGMSLAVQFPQRVTRLILNGLLINTQADRDDFANNYLPPFEPSHDATHLFKVWWRMREQSLFFPWYNRKADARMVFGIREASAIQEATLDFMAAGDNYRRGYGAALAAISQDFVDKLKVKTTITAVKADPLWEHVGRAKVAEPVEVKRFDTMEPLLEMSRSFLAEGVSSDAFDLNAVDQTGMRRIHGGSIASHHGQAPKALALPDLGGETASDDALWSNAITPVCAANPAGHGLSNDGADLPAHDGIEKLFTLGLGIAHLPPLMARYPNAKIVAADLLYPVSDEADYLEQYIPDMTPEASGGHLAKAFLAARNAIVFWPWFKTEHDKAIPGEEAIRDAQALHVKTRALLRGWAAGRDKLKDVPAAIEALSKTDQDVTIALPDWAEGRSDIRKDFGGARIVYYDFKDRAKALGALL